MWGAVNKGRMGYLLTTGLAQDIAKQAETANLFASEAAKTQANAQKQAQMNVLRIAIQTLTTLLEHELLVWDFAGAIVIGLMLIDLNNQLARLLQ
jgi:hypothetical protein